MADRDLEVRKALQELARHQMIERLYRDILIDMAVCDIEGWDKMEYILQPELAGHTGRGTRCEDCG